MPHAKRRIALVVILCGILAVAVCLTPARSFAAESSLVAPVRIAILTGEGDRAVAEPAVAQLEVALSAVKDITLLERAAIRKILAEQKLSAAGFSDPATAVKLGKLLSVELFLFLERVPNTNPAICRAQVIESLTGMVLAVGLSQENQLDMAQVRSWLWQALEKQRTPPAERRCVGILGLTNEEPGQALDGLARTLWMLMSADLQACPSLILLDREHLEWLQQEKGLTAAELALRTSTVLIEGGLRKSPGNGGVDLTLLLQPLAGGAPDKLTLRFAPQELSAFRPRLIDAIAERLKLKPPALKVTDAEAEGKFFLAQCPLLVVSGESDAALRAAEAAYALWPCRATRLELACSCGDFVIGGMHRTSATTAREDMRALSDVTEAEQLLSLRYQQRRLTILCELYQAYFAPDGSGSSADVNHREWGDLALNSLIGGGPGLGIVIERAKGEAAAVQSEVVALQRNLFDIVATAARRNAKSYSGAYWTALSSAMNDAIVRHHAMSISNNFDGERARAAAVREVFNLWKNAPADHERFYGSFTTLFQGAITQLQRLTAPDALKNPNAVEARKEFASAFSSFTRDPDPLIRCMANLGLVVVDPDACDAAEGVLKYLRDEIDWSQFDQAGPGAPVWGSQVASMGDVAWPAFNLLSQRNPQLAAAYCEQIMGPWMEKGGDAWRIACWSEKRLFELWASAVEKSQGKAEADAVYGRIIAALQESLDRWPNLAPDHVRLQMRNVAALRESLGVMPTAPAATLAGDDPWNEYEVRPLGLKVLPFMPNAAYSGASGFIVHGDRLYCVLLHGMQKAPEITHKDGVTLTHWKSPDKGIVTLTVHKFPEGGPALRTEKLDMAFWHGEMWPAFVGERLYIGTLKGLLILSDNGPLRLLTEADGLPGTSICAMDAYGGKLYMCLGSREETKRALVVYDPETQASRIIASNTALEPDRRLHTDWNFQMILADEAGKRLWIGHDGGVLCYDPEADKLDDAVKMWFGHAANPMAFCPGGLIFTTSGYAVGYDVKFVDLQTLKMKDLSVGKAGLSPWPAWYDGTVLITGGPAGYAKSALYLHRPGKEPAPLRLTGWIYILQMTPHGLLAIDTEGEGYLIQKKEPTH